MAKPKSELKVEVTGKVSLSSSSESSSFEQEAEEATPGLVGEFWDFMVHNKAWWITPIVLVLLLFGLVLVLAGSVAAPFIYTIF